MTSGAMSEVEISETLDSSVKQLSTRQRRIWDAVSIVPKRWSQERYGAATGGFWVVGLLGRVVIWYNEIENGFEFSYYSKFGKLDEYTANQFELKQIMERIFDTV